MFLVTLLRDHVMPLFYMVSESTLAQFDALPLPILVFFFFVLLFIARTPGFRTRTRTPLLPTNSPPLYNPHDLSPNFEKEASGGYPFPQVVPYSIQRSFSAPSLFSKKRGEEDDLVSPSPTSHPLTLGGSTPTSPLSPTGLSGLTPLTSLDGLSLARASLSAKVGKRGAKKKMANMRDMRRASLGEIGKKGVPETIEEKVEV